MKSLEQVTLVRANKSSKIFPSSTAMPKVKLALARLTGTAVAIAILAACAGAPQSGIPSSVAAPETGYRVVRDGNQWNVLSNTNNIAMQATLDSSGSVAFDFKGGRAESMSRADIEKAFVPLGDGRYIILKNNKAIVYSASGAVRSSAVLSGGVVRLYSADGRNVGSFAFASSKEGVRRMWNHCDALAAAYAVAVGAEVAAGLTLDPVALLGATAVALDIAAQIQQDCPE